MLAAYTTGSAYVNGREHSTGRVARGFLADLVVLDRDVFAGDDAWSTRSGSAASRSTRVRPDRPDPTSSDEARRPLLLTGAGAVVVRVSGRHEKSAPGRRESIATPDHVV